MSTNTATNKQQELPSPDKFLTHDYIAKGRQLKLKDDTEFYASGTAQGKKGVILIPDTMGWNAGRIRNIADYLGENDFLAVVPSILGTSNEAESGPSFFESHSWGEYIKQTTFAHFRPKIHSLVNYFKEEGVDKIALVGFSWGGWLAANILASDLSDNFSCGILSHPSINLEEKMYGGSVLELMSRVNRPVLLVQSKGEPRDYQHLIQMLKHKAPTSDLLDFSNIESGFVLRGNLDSRETRQAVVMAMEQIYSFLQEHYEMKTEDLIREVPKSSRSTGFESKSSAEGWMDIAQEGVAQASDFARRTGERMYDSAQQVYQGTGERLQQAGDRLGQGWQQTKEGAQNLYNQAGERVDEAGERIQETTQQARERAQQGWEQTKQGAQDTYQWTGEKTQQGMERAEEGAQWTGDKAKEGWEKTKEGAQQAGERAQDTYNWAGERINKGTQRAKEGGQEAYETAKDRTNEASERGHEGWEQTKQGAKDTYNKAGEKAQQGKEQAQEGYDKAKDRVGQGVEQGKSYAQATEEKTGEAMKQTGQNVKQRSQGSAQQSESQENLQDKMKRHS